MRAPLVAGRVVLYVKSYGFIKYFPMSLLPQKSTLILAAIPSLGILLALLLAYFLR